MEQAKRTAERIALLMGAEIEETSGRYQLKKSRTLEIDMQGAVFKCVLDLDIYFEELAEDGTAFNKAEILLLPKECKTFLIALIQYGIPLPPVYRQWQVANPNIVALYLEAVEPPEHFAGRLAEAFQAIEN
ncbi:DUF1259 domain-containing protein [Planococcus chinensis]|uniref:DUF1259 domain-containing protein n=1 Tax=Planococcus chinensis TaxID=272917 RepID=A0ABW4QDM3_9BACL